MRKYTRGEITKIILKSLVAGALFATVLALPGLAQIYTLFNPKDSRDTYRLRKSIHNMQKQKLIRTYKKGGRDFVEITEKGKKRILSYKLEEIKIKKSKLWDGWWYIIIFDIPEKKRNARQTINVKLKEIGLYPLQKSTFISPYSCKEEIDFIGNYFKVRDYIKYIKAKDIEGDTSIKKYFKI